jgi:hypothetical protein
LLNAKVEPPAEVPAGDLCRPAVKGKLDNLLHDVNEASVGQQQLVCEIAVQAYRTAETIRGAQKFICPLYNVLT